MHGPAAKLEADNAAAKKSKIGLYLFFFYVIIYGGFVFIGLFTPHLLGVHILGSQSLAIVYGFGLIILAIIMGFIYNSICTKLEDKMNKKGRK